MLGGDFLSGGTVLSGLYLDDANKGRFAGVAVKNGGDHNQCGPQEK